MTTNYFLLLKKRLLFKSKDKGIKLKQINSLKKGYYNSLCSTTSKLFLIKNSNDITYLLGSRRHRELHGIILKNK